MNRYTQTGCNHTGTWLVMEVVDTKNGCKSMHVEKRESKKILFVVVWSSAA